VSIPKQVAVALIASTVGLVSGCKLLDKPVYKPGAPDADGNPTPPVLVVDDDGTERTVGEELADAIEGQGSAAVGTLSALGGPLAPILGLAGMLGLGGAAAALRKRHPGAKV
jgi:hypothetical protein